MRTGADEPAGLTKIAWDTSGRRHQPVPVRSLALDDYQRQTPNSLYRDIRNNVPVLHDPTHFLSY
jgi:hypothetical protein